MADGNTIQFSAKWHSGIEHLKETPSQSTWNTVKRIAYNVISVIIPIIGFIRLVNYFFHVFAKSNVLPSIYFPKVLYEKTIKHFDHLWSSAPLGQYYSLNPITVETADNVNLAGHFIKHKDSDEDTPTVLIFQPNAVPSKYTAWWMWMAEGAINRGKPCNFIIWDYRATGESKGAVEKATDLVKDGDAMLQFAREKLGVANDKLIVYGFSVGGIVSAETLGCNPDFDGRYVSERSLVSVTKLVKERLPYTGSAIAFMSKGKWELNALEACKKMNAKRLVLSHEEDSVIPYSASIALALKKNPFLSANDLFIELQSPVYTEGHTTPLPYCFSNHIQRPTEEVLDFIFQPKLYALIRQAANA